MNCKLFNVLSFAAGAVIGSAVTWKLLKTKYDKEYEEKYQEEVREAKAFYKKKAEYNEAVSQNEDVAVSKITKDKPDIMEYAAKIQELKYAGEVARGEHEYVRKEEDSMKDEPYVISEEEYDEAGFDTETLTYFADGVLTDWFNEVVEDPEELVGSEALERFDEFADDGDTVFVRNPAHATDYEIQRDHRNYRDVFPESTED